MPTGGGRRRDSSDSPDRSHRDRRRSRSRSADRRRHRSRSRDARRRRSSSSSSSSRSRSRDRKNRHRRSRSRSRNRRYSRSRSRSRGRRSPQSRGGRSRSRSKERSRDVRSNSPRNYKADVPHPVMSAQVPPPLGRAPPPPPVGGLPGVPPPLGTVPPPPPPRILPPVQRLESEQVKTPNNRPQVAQPARTSASAGLKMNLGKVSQASKSKLAQVFNPDSSDEEEEMPEEARIRMRNVGRDTITSSGPNSFGKTRQGFTDTGRLFEKKLWEAMDEVSNDNSDRRMKK